MLHQVTTSTTAQFIRCCDNRFGFRATSELLLAISTVDQAVQFAEKAGGRVGFQLISDTVVFPGMGSQREVKAPSPEVGWPGRLWIWVRTVQFHAPKPEIDETVDVFDCYPVRWWKFEPVFKDAEDDLFNLG